MLLKGSGVNGFINNNCPDNHIALLQKAAKGSNLAFEQLMDEHLKLLYNYIRLHVNSSEDIKDIMQDAMLGIWKGLGSFDSKSSFKTWIMGITKRKIADYYRKVYSSNHKGSVDISQCDDILYSDDNIDLITDKISVNDALNNLSKGERELVFLVFNAQLTYKQIEQITGIPDGTIKSRMSSIRLKLRKELTQGGV